MSDDKNIPTPRTDAMTRNNGIELPLTTVPADFARQLERELFLLKTQSLSHPLIASIARSAILRFLK